MTRHPLAGNAIAADEYYADRSAPQECDRCQCGGRLEYTDPDNLVDERLRCGDCLEDAE